jgi:hypothetical protein
MIAVLHMGTEPVPASALTLQYQRRVDKCNWKNIRGDGKFLFPVKALSVLGLVRLCAKAQIIILESRNNYGETVGRFAKSLWSPKSGGISRRYTHKIAISNHRIACNDQNVTLGTKIIE